MKTDALMTNALIAYNKVTGSVPADAIDTPPTPIPGMENPLSMIVGYVKWGGLSIAALAVLVGIVVVIGTVFAGWNVAKKFILYIVIALVGGVVLGAVGQILTAFGL